MTGRRRRDVLTVGGLAVAALAFVVAALAVGGTGGASTDDRRAMPELVRPAVDFLGDSVTGGSEMGGVGTTNYTAVLGSRYGWRVGNHALGGTGYTQGIPRQPAFGAPSQLQKIAADDPFMVIVAGGRNDAIVPAATVNRTASTLFADLARVVPHAKVVVVGVIWPDDRPPPALEATNDAIRDAAEARGLTFIDPIAEKWFSGPTEALIGRDRTHPTDQGHRHIAEVLGADLERLRLVGAAAGGG